MPGWTATVRLQAVQRPAGHHGLPYDYRTQDCLPESGRGCALTAMIAIMRPFKVQCHPDAGLLKRSRMPPELSRNTPTFRK